MEAGDLRRIVENSSGNLNGRCGEVEVRAGAGSPVMRLAIIVSSSYSECGTLTELPDADAQAELLSRRLSERDAAFTVHVVPAVRGMAEELESVLASIQESREPVETALFFFSGYVVVSDEDVPALLLDGERLSTLSLRRVRRLFTQLTERSFFVLDTVTAFEGARTPREVTALLGEGFALDRVDMHVLVANRRGPTSGDGPSPFTSLLALTLDWQATDHGLSPRELYLAMQNEPSLYDRVEAVQFEAGSQPLHVLLPRTSQAFSVRPRVSSVPARGGAEARADVLVEQGDLQSAFVEYTAALAELGPADGVRHPPIYAKIARALKAAGRDEDALRYYEAALELNPELPSALEGASELRIEAGDLREALALLRRWLNVEPNAEGAAERAARILVDSGEWAELANLYTTVLDRVSNPRAAVQLALKIDGIYRDVLDEPTRGFPALVRAAQLAPHDPRVHARLATAFESRGEMLRALDHALAAVSAEPERAEYHRDALRLFERCGEPDGAWHAASALEVLGKADVNESLLASAHRPSGLIPARAGLDESHWERRLLCPERDAHIDDLFRLLGSALVAVGLEAAVQKRRTASVDASTEVDPKTSTVTLVKTLGWVARLLGVALPRVHVVAGLRASFIAPPSAEPLLLVDRGLASGVDVKDLAFLIGRALVCFRPEHRPMTLFPTMNELTALVSSALSLGNAPQLPFKGLEGDAKVFARGLRRHLKPPQLSALESFAQGFPVRELNDKLLAWVRAVELASVRAALFACGDLELAVSLARRHPLGTAVTLEDQVKTLLGYALSPAYTSLRKHVGVLVPR